MFHRTLMRICLVVSLLQGFINCTYAQSVDTLTSYFQLKLYSGAADTVYLNDERYFGYFVKDNCTEEDNGTRILSTSNECWSRLFDLYHPRFWAINGPSPDPFTSSVRNEVDAINSAAYAAYLAGGDTIAIDSLYLIDRIVNLWKGNTYLGRCEDCGFKRIDPPKTVLTDTAKIGDSKIKVASNIGFKTKQKINIANGQAYDSIAGFASYTASVAPLIGGDSIIFLSGLSIQRQMLPGDSVSLFFEMLRGRGNDIDSVYLENLLIDGNSGEYTLNYDWRTNSSVLLPTVNYGLVNNCRFINIPNENFFLCGIELRNCTGGGFNGSVLHFSCNDFDHPTTVMYNNFENTNLVGDEVMEHSEAALTFSAKVQNLRVAYNRLEGVNESGIGTFLNDDMHNEITDNLFNTAGETVELSPFYNHQDSNLIYNNKNMNQANLAEDNCWVEMPELQDTFACAALSSLDDPLVLGDTIQISLGGFQMEKSNENFVKAIAPIYETDYFDLAHMAISNSSPLSENHQWIYDGFSTLDKQLVFDNGHRDGINGIGNWGYEGCTEPEKCTALDLYFVVTHLPDTLANVNCPLLGLDVLYDSEVATWEHAYTCEKEPVYFDSVILGQPTLSGSMINAIKENENSTTLEVFPNPVVSDLFVKTSSALNLEYRIYTPFGKLIKSGVLNQNKIFVGNISAGNYILQLIQSDNLQTTFFTKQ